MSTKDEILELKLLVGRLRAADRDLRVYGANGHKYRTGPTLSDAKISEFEQRHRIKLPEDYRLWLQLVGSGCGGDAAKVQKNPWFYAGLGPFNGIYPLHDDLMSKNAHLQFPFTESTELTDAQYREWEDELEDTQVPGLLEIASQGCAGTVQLVVNGSNHGSVWSRWDEHFDLINPSFAGWIREWAERVLPRVIRERVTNAVEVGMTKAQAVAICGENFVEHVSYVEAKILRFEGFVTEFGLDENDKIVRIIKHSV